MGDYDYLLPKKVADFVLKYIPESGKILDASSGTGLAGKVLYDYGYTNLVAIDISEEMLHKARHFSYQLSAVPPVIGRLEMGNFLLLVD
ncbi:methyltransferase domain-containing protein [Dapis sp. BLCC M229]|uniref:methyltransferase domain-containing protein n=1 Tax=Dapis sp. BLCC M229 TaxID=3400188 RepID=UPI003CFB274A